MQTSYENRALMTDFYELTMAQGYFNAGTIDRKASFELFYRDNPFEGGYAIAAGLKDAIQYLKNFKFSEDDIQYLQNQNLFTDPFLEYLTNLTFQGEVDGVAEGTVVFPYEPIMQLTAPLGMAQMVESALLNIVNYQTLIATKAARICFASKRSDTVLEFGLRRGHGDGAHVGARAAIVGGCVGTSNTLAGKIYDLPVSGTQAHSWIQSFESELAAFRAYAETFPKNTILLVDTYNTLEYGIPNAIKVAKEMEDQGHKLRGIRIDSGDLAWLAVQAFNMLDEADLNYVKIVLSSDLDEFVIESIVNQILDAIKEDDSLSSENVLDRLLWGVGTNLITGSGGEKAALGGVYKLVEIEDEPVIKISENRKKTTNPGRKNLWRIKSNNDTLLADVVGLYTDQTPEKGDRIYHRTDPTKYIDLEDCKVEPLHIDLMEKYQNIKSEKDIWQESKSRCNRQLYNGIDDSHLRFLNPHIYKVSLTENLFNLKQKFLEEYKD